MGFLIAVYFIALIIEIIIRAPVDRKRRQGQISERRVTTQEQVLLGLLTLGGFVVPLIYAFTIGWILPITSSQPGQAGSGSC